MLAESPFKASLLACYVSQTKIWPWKKAIALVDMNAFFCSVEQLDHPHLRNKPIAVVPNDAGRIIIAASYEAKARQVTTGCKKFEALQRCPNIIFVNARPQRYAEISKYIMHQLYCHVTHLMEIYSIDEAFLDVTRMQDFFPSPEALAIHIQKVILRSTGLPASVGLSGDRTTAKWACKRFRPLGLGIVEPHLSKTLLSHVPIDELCGVNKGVKRYLSRFSVTTCAELSKLPTSILTQKYGNTGRRLWLMAQGEDPEPIHEAKFPKSLGNSKIIPSHQRHSPHVDRWILKLSHQLSSRLARLNISCRTLIVAFTYDNQQKWKFQTPISHIDPLLWHQIMIHAKDSSPHTGGISWIGLYAKGLFTGSTSDLWQSSSITPLNQALNHIHDKWGKKAITPLSALAHDEHDWTPGISPAWRPQGIRQYFPPSHTTDTTTQDE